MGLNVKGSTEFNFEISGKTITHSCVVVDVEQVGYQGLLGLDFLHQHQAINDHKNHTLHFPWAAVPLDINSGQFEVRINSITTPPLEPIQPEIHSIILQQDTKISETSCTTVTGVTSLPAGTEVYLQTNQPGENCPALPMVTKIGENGEVNFLLTNPDSNDYLLKAGKLESVSLFRLDKTWDLLDSKTAPTPMTNFVNEDQFEPTFLPNPVSQPLTDEERLSQFNFSGVAEEHLKPLQDLILKYADVFAFGDQPLSCTHLAKHKIDTGSAEPVKVRPYRVPVSMRPIMQAAIDDMLRQNIIEPASSPWSAPMIMVARKGRFLTYDCSLPRGVSVPSLLVKRHFLRTHSRIDSVSC
ncbi:uncharacterized protein LOC132204973 [Neocloeon triangulifer]|uniref:uncharacterized protein LOC132204973 n=1 Tax=Neocloeon triangulifer TaxID=2078957 RepID=UPI00286EE711|nr:uncharacterized protein LOC132204973 [Neocloeon triangulifer]